MRKYLISGVLTALLVSVYVVSFTSEPQVAVAAMTLAERKTQGCRYQSLDPGHWTKNEVRRTIVCAADRWNVSLATALMVAERESHFGHRAYNSYSCASGIYQHLCTYWYSRVASYNAHVSGKYRVTNTSPFNARANILVSMWMVHRGGWGPWM